MVPLFCFNRMKVVHKVSAWFTTVLMAAGCGNSGKVLQSTMNVAEGSSIHDLSIPALSGTDTIDLSAYKGKKMLLVNVASKCGYTPQYAGLESLYEAHKDSLVIIGFPCNQFLMQEPGSADEIASFCQINYGVTFPLSAKIDVKGDNQHEIYQWLTQKKLNGVGDYKISWNFNKFLIDENGKLLAYFGSDVEPLGP